MGKFKTGVALEQDNVDFLCYLQQEQKIKTLTDIINFVIREYKKMRMDLANVDFENQKPTALKIKSCFQTKRKKQETSSKTKKTGRPRTRPLTAKELLEREIALTVIKEKQKLEKAEIEAQKREKERQEQYKKGFDNILDSFMSGDNGDNIFGL